MSFIYGLKLNNAPFEWVIEDISQDLNYLHVFEQPLPLEGRYALNLSGIEARMVLNL